MRSATVSTPLATLPVARSPAPEAAEAAPSGFDVGAELGRGAMGTVHVAHDRVLGRSVAYKVTNEAARAQPDLVRRFLTEAQITAQLEHPNVVPVYGLARDGGGPLAYTMRMVRGQTLRALLDEAIAQHQAGAVDVEHGLRSLIEVFLKVCDAMAFAHSRGVVHRDLKPANIMLGAYGEAYVMDWGIATMVASKHHDRVTVDAAPDEANVAIGTPAYMSPEQARGEPVDGRSDEYSLGLLLAEILTLRRAGAGTARARLEATQQGQRDPIFHAFGASLPPEVVAIVEKATAPLPADRYADVRAPRHAAPGGRSRRVAPPRADRGVRHAARGDRDRGLRGRSGAVDAGSGARPRACLAPGARAPGPRGRRRGPDGRVVRADVGHDGAHRRRRGRRPRHRRAAGRARAPGESLRSAWHGPRRPCAGPSVRRNADQHQRRCLLPRSGRLTRDRGADPAPGRARSAPQARGAAVVLGRRRR